MPGFLSDPAFLKYGAIGLAAGVTALIMWKVPKDNNLGWIGGLVAVVIVVVPAMLVFKGTDDKVSELDKKLDQCKATLHTVDALLAAKLQHSPDNKTSKALAREASREIHQTSCK
jgi:hypothetical protein